MLVACFFLLAGAAFRDVWGVGESALGTGAAQAVAGCSPAVCCVEVVLWVAILCVAVRAVAALLRVGAVLVRVVAKGKLKAEEKEGKRKGRKGRDRKNKGGKGERKGKGKGKRRHTGARRTD